MNTPLKTKIYMLSVLIVGFVSLVTAVYHLPFEKLDFYFLILFCFTIGFGSRVTLEIPRFKSHIAVSDTFIFLALLLYGGKIAIVLAAVEAFCSSWRFCNKKITVFFNVAAMAFSTTLVVVVLKSFGLYSDIQAETYADNFNNFFVTLSVMALTQFLSNTALAAVYGALKSEKPFWETWKTKYAWTFITYFVGAVSAGALVKATGYIGFGVVIATFPIIFFIYLTYRMYMRNVEMATSQAEQAESNARVLERQAVALRESEERFRSAFDYAPIGIALVSPDGRWLKVNRALTEILGYTEAEFLAADFQSMLFKEDLGGTLVKLHELLTGKILTCQLEQRYVHKTGKTVWACWSVSTASEVNEKRPSLIFQIQDITDKKSAEEKLQHEATHDALTGLPNRACFMTRLAKALDKAQSNPLYKVSVLFIDLDRFKVVNDSLGHLVGDQLLIGISDRLRECLRPNDIVARLGGDEFTILVEGRYETSEVVGIAERLREKFVQPFDLSGHEIYSSASIGILHASEKHLAPEDVMRDADTAMYQAKRAGKARHEVFNEKMHEAVKKALQLETDLRRAIERDELSVFYQPIHSLENGELQGFEALARWQHREFGVLSPDKFIPLAEEINLIDRLGEQILRKACSQMRFLKDAAFADSPLTLSVNLSCKQFAQKNLVSKIKQILDETEFSPSRLKLEITETVFFEHREKAVEMLAQLSDFGIEMYIDDFGTGYSNLSYLMQLPISTLKIDGSFISPITEDGKNTEIVETIVLLARNLGMKVIAEGVETEAQVEQLKKLNCEGAQGFYFSRPMNYEDLREFLNEKTGISSTALESRFEDVSVLMRIQ
ncbi:MAG: diguanylate cyclase/phosphodiesterase (GGDEF & EAL domains) with PAS/PAC sensor(s) [uncultured Pyrinomonadaceae bacterium]|uniref:Diguanylate cyclase/phosphodiesterase (GGDEF & EAL domains) with PAS/PAC sensor(S) n=1 Tax=uncultured Pyrinomonadaceae bacterium TaxID=2283094 RepID=A0A6J4PPB4_9BACT|nr:MAG: diguanylate cyclase/phosphodiesterase (GGDEF & EAL domains) with PAS/PAC sensor(s) [uncultured Pyrinomonadaceae bacterium]